MSAELYDIVLSDPPWAYYGGNGRQGGAASNYKTVEPAQLVEVARPPLQPKGVLFMWVTSPQLDVGMRLLHEWGLHYRGVSFVWVKTLRFGLGVPIGAKGPRPSIVKPTSEYVLAASRVRTGRPMKLHNEAIRQVIMAPPTEHSVKPDAVAEAIELMYPDARKLEMFARRRRPGWDAHGDEVPE